MLQLKIHLERNKLCSTTQSENKESHSCETLLLDLVKDLTAAFNTIDREVLLRRLQEKFKVTGVSLR